MSRIDYAQIRRLLTEIPTDHDADGEHRPVVGEVFAPEQHASALAPSTLIVVGARGAGKSFWAGVLGQHDTRLLAAQVYPRLNLDRLLVSFGYNGFDSGSAVSRRTVEARTGERSHDDVVLFWQTVILRSALDALGDPEGSETISAFMTKYSDPEAFEAKLRSVDQLLDAEDKTCLVIFDALDTLSREWQRLTTLTDALFEAAWSLRARKHIKAKIFIRPDQLNDEGLRFVELPKLRSGRVELDWSRADLYGLLYTRLSEQELAAQTSDFQIVCERVGAPFPTETADRLRKWPLAWNEHLQKRVMDRLAGLYMGRSATKGATYPWTFNHLADGRGVVTPRSFLKLFVEAARQPQNSTSYALTPESIRHGLREASKTRVEQLALEYPWIKRALAPLAGLKVPCQRWEIYDAWDNSNTASVISKAAKQEGFLPPYRSAKTSGPEEALEAALERIGVLSFRPDGRADMPDLFRIAARMLKLGGVALKART